MAKVIFNNKKSLKSAKRRTRGVVSYREMKDGRVIATKWPTKRKLLKKQNKKCLCDNPTCAKCLGINCQDKDCQIHTKERKESWRRRWEKVNKKPFSHPKNY